MAHVPLLPGLLLADTASFDAGWRFFRGDAPPPAAAAGAAAACDSPFCAPAYDDAGWDPVDVPHDWSSLDLPPRAEDRSTPTLGLRYSDWKFKPGDDAAYATRAFDDADWASVQAGPDWRTYGASVTGGYDLAQPNATGWYRAHFSVPDFHVNASAWNPNQLIASLGVVAGCDQTYVNGQLIGGIGNPARADPSDYLGWRRYVVPAGLLEPGAHRPNVVAVRVRSVGNTGGKAAPADPVHGDYPGGLYDDPLLDDADVRDGPFDAGTSPNGRSYGYTVGGVGWYRKHFDSPALPAPGSRVFLRFDGVYKNANVYLNGKLLGNHPYGYTTFEFDITDQLLRPPPNPNAKEKKQQKKNVVAVKVSNLGRNSRWYSGSGIYRHTWLRTTAGSTYIPMWGVGVSTPQIDLTGPHTADGATVNVEVDVTNAGSTAQQVTANVTITDPAGRRLRSAAVASPGRGGGVSVAPGATETIVVEHRLAKGDVHLWHPESPDLYSASVSVYSSPPPSSVSSSPPPSSPASAPADTFTQTFGIRDLDFSAERGFRLNGVETLLYGGCLHHANGPLGSRAYDRAEERRVEILRKNGYNAIRTSHNPVSPAFLDACDRLGMLVMDEAFDCWEQGKNTDDYHVYFDDWWRRDMRAMVRRDRNHPAVVMWSIGNEIPMRDTPKGHNLSAVLSEYVRELDFDGSGRAVTSAVPFVQDQSDAFFAPLDVAGYNYSPQRYQSDHVRDPKRIIVGTESFPMSSFDMWSQARNSSWVIGDFIWTAFDYLGESAIGSATFTGDVDEVNEGFTGSSPFAWHISFCGDIDVTGHRKPQGAYRNVLWGVSDLEIAVHRPMGANHTERVSGWGWPEELDSWSWDGHPHVAGPDTPPLSVNVYAKAGLCDRVSLTLNGKAVAGSPQPVGHDTQLTATFQVPYTAGTLEATCGTAAASLKTTGSPAALRLDPDRAAIADDPNDLSFVTATVVDAAGARIPQGEEAVAFAVVSGPGRLAAVGTGNPKDTSSFHSGKKTTWMGRALAIVQPTGGAGAVVLEATAMGKTVRTTIHVG